MRCMGSCCSVGQCASACRWNIRNLHLGLDCTSRQILQSSLWGEWRYWVESGVFAQLVLEPHVHDLGCVVAVPDTRRCSGARS